MTDYAPKRDHVRPLLAAASRFARESVSNPDGPASGAMSRSGHRAPCKAAGAGVVVVTGAAGFIGSHLVDALLARGHEVVGLDRRAHGNAIADVNLAQARERGGLHLHEVELADDDLDDLVRGADTVYHLAAVPGVRGSWGTRFRDYVSSNVLATHRLLRACEHAGVRRLVLASSSSVYGPASRPSREPDPTDPISPYGVSKLAAEQLCLAHAQRADTELTVAALRYFTVYGPRQRPGMAIRQVLLGALTGVEVPLYGDGRQRRAFTYVDDVVAATLAASTADLTAAVFNVAGATSATMLDVLELARQITGRAVPVIMADPQPGDADATNADLSRAHRGLGYRPAVELADGMARQATWLDRLSPTRSMLTPPNHLETLRCSH